MRSTTALSALAFIVSTSAHTLVEILKASPDLSTLLGAISAVPGLADTLNAAQGITVFAPTNAAFSAVAADSLEGQAIASSDIDGIASILSYHVVNASIPASAITVAPQFVPTLLTSTNVFAGAPATLVDGGQLLGAALVNESVVLTSGLLLTSTVVEADIAAGGAIVHKIDSVLTVPRNASTTASAAGLTAIVDALVAAELAVTVDTLADITVFIPTNDAFAAISSVTSTVTKAQLRSVLTLHVLSGSVFYSVDIPSGTTELPTVSGENITIVNDGSTITVDQAKVIVPNVALRNGVGHVIDSVLIPAKLAPDY